MSQGRIHFRSGRGLDIWRWRAGVGRVVIRDPLGKAYSVPTTEIVGCPWPEIERARWKKTRGCEVTPAKVRAYIERELA